MFLYNNVQDPHDLTDSLNQIIKEANKIGIEVVSGMWLEGEYSYIYKQTFSDAFHSVGYCFKDTGIESDLQFPPFFVEGGKVFEMSCCRVELNEPIPEVPQGFKCSRYVTERLMGMEKRRGRCDSCVEAAKVMQYFQDHHPNMTIYIPNNYSIGNSCQNIVDGPLMGIDDEKIIVVESAGVFRPGKKYSTINKKKSLEGALRGLKIL